MLYREIMAVCSEIHTKHINTLCGQNVELLNVILAVHIVTTASRVWPAVASPTLTHVPHSTVSMTFFEGAGLYGNSAESLSHARVKGGEGPV